jgi:hypothetical protein
VHDCEDESGEHCITPYYRFESETNVGISWAICSLWRWRLLACLIHGSDRVSSRTREELGRV